MAHTRLFKSGNSQAIRIPSELAYDDMGIEMEISRHGDVLTIYPKRGSVREAVEILRRMPKPANVERIERTETRERNTG
ncbi:MAG: antitoxin [Rhizomicrobium sp.]